MITLSRYARILAGAAAISGLSVTGAYATDLLDQDLGQDLGHFEDGEAAEQGEPAAQIEPLEIDQQAERSAVETSPLPATGAARTALEQRLAETPFADFYAGRAYEPLWIGEDGKPNAASRALLDALAQAPSHALPSRGYGAEELSSLAASLGEGRAAEFELKMTRALVAYSTDATSGVVTPSKVDKEIKIKPPRPEPVALLEGFARAGDPADWFADLLPRDEEYARLREHYARMQEVVRTNAWGAPVPEGRTLRQGDSDKRVEALRKRLIAMGDLSSGAADGEGAVIADNSVVTDAGQMVSLTDPWVYGEGLVTAVKRFQSRHGLNTDGVVGPATLAALNASAEERLRQVAVNMERLRWLNRDLGDKRVMVNIAGFTMKLIDNGRETFTSRVVVGQKTNQTPEFSDEMEHLVVNPSWNVPWSIATKEILPKLKQDPAYLARNNMRLVGAEEFFIDWWSVTPSNFPGRIKQDPGPGNALGRVKFMFPNNNAIYLHDTPSKSLFAKDMRAFSHGCVRVEKPFEFAEILLGAQESDPAGAFGRLLDTERERWVNLQEHIPVHIGYRTAWIDQDGVPQFRADIYGRDQRVMAALEEAGVSLAVN